MLEKISKVVSYLFYPLFIPYYSFIILLNDNAFYATRLTDSGRLILEGTLFVTLILLPFAICLLLWKKKLIRTIFMVDREERVYPLIIVSIFYYLTYYLLKGLHVSAVYSYFMLGLTFIVVCALVITFFYKISLYMLSTGSLLGLLFGLSFGHGIDQTFTIMGTLVVSGLLATFRSIDETHKPWELYSGLLLGFGVMFLLFYFV